MCSQEDKPKQPVMTTEGKIAIGLFFFLSVLIELLEVKS
jgi:hypothetical protein